MREALARSDFDAVRRSPAPQRARRPAAGTRARGTGRAAASGAGAVAGRLAAAGLALIGGGLLALLQLAFRALERWPVSVVGGLLGVALSAAIIVNAVSLQEGPHPSPLFGAAQTTTSRAAPAAVKPNASKPSASKPDSAGQGPVTAPAPPRRTATPTEPARQEAPARPAAGSDPIAHLLSTGAPPPAAAASAQRSGVLAVQKALVALGYEIAADGLNGPATREAVSAFEKLEGLPVTGDPTNAAMRKALGVATGMTLD